MTTEKKIPLGEAPASLNFYGVTKGGWTVQFTLRDVDEYVLLTRFGDFVKKLDEFYVTPKGKQNGNGKAVSPNTPADVPNEDPGWCKVHDTKMFENENDRGKWWSHKTDDPAYTKGFCNGKPK